MNDGGRFEVMNPFVYKTRFGVSPGAGLKHQLVNKLDEELIRVLLAVDYKELAGIEAHDLGNQRSVMAA
jgi:hypothetical protein